MYLDVSGKKLQWLALPHGIAYQMIVGLCAVGINDCCVESAIKYIKLVARNMNYNMVDGTSINHFLTSSFSSDVI